MRNRHPLLTAVLAFVAVFVVITSAAAQNFPQLSGRVVDAAGILDTPTREMLTGKLAALEAKTTDQLVIATVSSLEGKTVEDYANRLFRLWRPGQKDTNNGVLLLIATVDRKVRIEVGYGLEGTLPDAVAKYIIENSIVPRFRAGDIPGGIVRGAEDIMQVLGGDSAHWKELATARPASDSQSEDWSGWLVALIILFFMAPTIYSFYREFFGPRPVDRGRGSSGQSVSGSSSDSSSSWSSWSSSSSDSFSGGGGSSGGGGASGSW